MITTDFPPLRLGILGAARIARAFAQGVAPSQRVVVTAVASRDAAKAEQFAREIGVSSSHGSYEALLTDPLVDAVYIPLPNSLHAQWSIRACEAGKHVLCEKPLAATAADARAMFDAAQRGGVCLMEGYPYRAQPQTQGLLKLIADGAVGRVQLIQSSCGFTLPPGPNIRLDPTLAGGALMDAGAYPVSLARMVAGEKPARVQSFAVWKEAVDRTLSATIEFPNEILAQISCSFTTSYHRQALIVGTAGIIQSNYLNHPPLDRPAEILLKRGMGPQSAYEKIETPPVNGFLAEAEAFESRVRALKSGVPTSQHPGCTSPEESIDIVSTLEAILLSARTGQTVSLHDLT